MSQPNPRQLDALVAEKVKVHIGYYASICWPAWHTFTRDSKLAKITPRWKNVTCKLCLRGRKP